MINQIDQTLYRLSNLDSLQQKLSYQASTGKKIEKGSDDSILYSRIISLDDKISTYEGLKTQIGKTTAQNNTSDSSLSETKNILDKIKAELIKANTGSTNDNGLSAIASSISGMKENLFDLANTQTEGEYVFAGSDTSVKPFEKNSDGSISYVGNNVLRKIAVEEGSYRERGVTGFDAMMYPSSTAYKGETLTFQEKDRIIDQDGNEWKLNYPSNNTLTKHDLDGNPTSETLNVTSNGQTPPTFSAVTPDINGIKMEARTSVFDDISGVINALKKVDNSGNKISDTESRALISKGLEKISAAFDSINIAHAELGGRNKVFEDSLERVNSKLTQYNILSQEIGAANLTEVAVKAKALELTYTALYSTINKTNQLSLVNFIN